MHISELTVERQAIWLAFADFYLDTELGDRAFQSIAMTILNSPYTFEQIKLIDKYEVFPVLQIQLLSPIGEWAAFNDEWLIATIKRRIERTTRVNRLFIELYYFMFKWMHKDYWEKLEIIYLKLKSEKFRPEL